MAFDFKNLAANFGGDSGKLKKDVDFIAAYNEKVSVSGRPGQKAASKGEGLHIGPTGYKVIGAIVGIFVVWLLALIAYNFILSARLKSVNTRIDGELQAKYDEIQTKLVELDSYRTYNNMVADIKKHIRTNPIISTKVLPAVEEVMPANFELTTVTYSNGILTFGISCPINSVGQIPDYIEKLRGNTELFEKVIYNGYTSSLDIEQHANAGTKVVASIGLQLHERYVTPPEELEQEAEAEEEAAEEMTEGGN